MEINLFDDNEIHVNNQEMVPGLADIYNNQETKPIRKRDENHIIDTLHTELLTVSKSDKQSGTKLINEIIIKMMKCYQKRAMAIVRKYENIDITCTREDLEQSYYLALLMALDKYDTSQISNMKFSSFLDWYIRKQFQQEIQKTKTVVCDIFDETGECVETVEQNKLFKIKKEIVAKGWTYRQKHRVVSLEDDDSGLNK
jgi:DNA-directed RNA polymerase specialized sigma subunit